MFNPVPGSVSFPKLEEEVGRFWRERDIYQKSLAEREGAEPFVFYEGPPTANGMPHPGHCLTRAIKDLFPRYKTMRGYRCERKAGWDTHGLPVEVEVCKALTEELGQPVHSKEDIEAYGVEPFIQKCQASVWRYMQEWERLTERLGFWVDLEQAYVTYHQSYVESVWWSLKNLFDRGLLYQGHKIVWWWAQGGTALSAGEVGQGYREVADPSVYVKFPLLDDDGNVTDTSLLVWTTTPWTLPSNQFAAVNPEIEYTYLQNKISGERVVVAVDCGAIVADKVYTPNERSGKVERDDSKAWMPTGHVFKGEEIVGKRYLPPFDCFYKATGHHFNVLVGDKSVRLGERQGVLASTEETEYSAWRVVPAEFVTTESGSGIVHQAPAFGEVDYEVLIKESRRFRPGFEPELINCVGPDGKFTDEAPEFIRGRWVKDCDKDIIRNLKERGLLFHQEQYLHDYPFCWRAEQDPLIQYPRESWFIKTTAFKDAMLANNQQINWLPEHIKGGRMGKFLESNVDWALSRERYWGTPLPIWQCADCGLQIAESGYDQLKNRKGATGFEVWEQAKAANPQLPDDLRVHKPYIDAITFDCEKCEGTMQRVPEVIDCWYDSGAMPFAQWGYKGQPGASATGAAEKFQSQFPADFISEALDQTRGWFYSQLAISTMMFGERSENRGQRSEPLSPTSDLRPPHPFRNCIVLGLMLGEDGQKMSKSKRNYREPNEIFDKYGADALRWYLFANQPPWTSIRYSEQAIKDSIPEFLLRLWNCYSFMVIYANIDEWDPGKEIGGQRSEVGATDASWFAGADSYRAIEDRDEIDRWVISELNRTIATVTERMDAYDNFGACGAITEFVDALSNWYVRRSRDRFWAKDKRGQEKLDAYWTLYECLLTTTKLIAPFTPFLAETMYRNLVGVFGGPASTTNLPSSQEKARNGADVGFPESVHLCDYPSADDSLIDQALSERMALVRLISSLGRRARELENLKVRQPLAKVEVILADATHQAWLESHATVIADELNVKAVEFTDQPEKYVDHQVLPNFKLLGKKLGKLMPKVKQALNQASGSELLANIRDNGKVNLTVDGQDVELYPEEVEVRLFAKPGYAAANDQGVVVVLATELTDELIAEGTARDLVRVIQDTRKDKGCEFTDRIEVGVETDDETVKAAIEGFADYIAGETLADSVKSGSLSGAQPIEAKLGDAGIKLYLEVL